MGGTAVYDHGSVALVFHHSGGNLGGWIVPDVPGIPAFNAKFTTMVTGGNGIAFNFGPGCTSSSFLPTFWHLPCPNGLGLHVQFRLWSSRVMVWLNGALLQNTPFTRQYNVDVVGEVTVDADKLLTVKNDGVEILATNLGDAFTPATGWSYMLAGANGGSKGSEYLRSMEIVASVAPTSSPTPSPTPASPMPLAPVFFPERA